MRVIIYRNYSKCAITAVELWQGRSYPGWASNVERSGGLRHCV